MRKIIMYMQMNTLREAKSVKLKDDDWHADHREKRLKISFSFFYVEKHSARM